MVALSKEEKLENEELLKKGKKKCSSKNSCGEIKDISEFTKRKIRRKDGSIRYNSLCKECDRKRSKEWRKNHPNYNRENSKCWREENPEKSKESSRKYREKNPIEVKERTKKWRKENPDYDKIRVKIYSEKNKEKIRISKKQYIKKRRKNDLLFNLNENISKMLFAELKKLEKNYKGKSKLTKIESTEFLHEYFDPMLKEGMTWENRCDVWHFDHILPVALFDYNDDRQIAICNHYTNLQPMFAKENIVKGSKYEGIEYFRNLPPKIIDRSIAPKPLIEAIERGEKIDFWTYYGKLPEYQERIQFILE